MKMPEDLLDPPKEYSVMPFWFWNDRLDENEILRQIDDFERHGVHGFVIHPRVGLPRDLAWMSDQLLGFYEVAIKEAQRRNMKVLLYDEGMYPSGSSCGQVVEANPDYQCRCLARVEHVNGKPYQLKDDENLITVASARNGRQMSIIDRKVNSRIRGLHYIGEGPDEDAPLASDILNPDAVDCFIDLVYRKLVNRFSAYVGETIIGIFTDEPDMLGRCLENDVFPSTRNIIGQINEILGYDFTPYLPALWSEDEQEAETYGQVYHAACARLLEKNYYSRLEAFCKQNGILLTGHPAQPDDLGALRFFGIPGQDSIWRWILPDTPTALEGAQSTQAKCSSSGMIHTGKRKNLNECCGAYGHELTWEEMVWLSNWCIVRGVNMLVPHAFYYSVRGCRKDERPPALGPNASWWPRFKNYADMFRRLCWINTDSRHICHVAIMGKACKLPWGAARVCFENQIDFNYIEERHLWEDAQLSENGIRLAGMDYRVLIIESDEDLKAKAAVEKLESAGCVIRYKEDSDNAELIDFIRDKIPQDVSFTQRHPGLRVRHVVKDQMDYYMLFNETSADFETAMEWESAKAAHQFDPVSGAIAALDTNEKLHFGPHEMKVILR